MAKIGGLRRFSNLSRRDGPSFVADAVLRVHVRASSRCKAFSPRSTNAKQAARANGSTPRWCRACSRTTRGTGSFGSSRRQYPGRAHRRAARRRRATDTEHGALLPPDGRAVRRRTVDAVLADERAAVAGVPPRHRSSTSCSRTREYEDAPNSDDPAVRVAFWERALTNVRTKTYDEWLKVFDDESRRVGRPLPPRHRAAAPPAARAGPPRRDHRRSRRSVRCSNPDRSCGWTRPPRRSTARRRASTSTRRASARSADAGVDAACDGRAPRHANRRSRVSPSRARHLLRRAVRRHAAHRPRRARDQDRAARRRPDPPHPPVPRSRRDQGAPGQGERRRRHREPTRAARSCCELVRRADAVLQSFRAGVAAAARVHRRRPPRGEPRPRVPQRARIRRRPAVRPPPGVRAHDRCGVGSRVPQRRRRRERPAESRPRPRRRSSATRCT